MRPPQDGPVKEIYLAGGCFWGVEKAMSLLRGVVSTQCGYANGDPHLRPDYLLVCSGHYGYAETVRVVYDESKVSLQDVLKAFFMIVDPTKQNRQGNDVGIQYRTGIYWTDENSGSSAREYAEGIRPEYPVFFTEVLPLENFAPAEAEHQRYLDRNPRGYCHIPFEAMAEISHL